MNAQEWNKVYISHLREVVALIRSMADESPGNTIKRLSSIADLIESTLPSADLSLVTAKLVIWQFEDSKWGLKNVKGIRDDKETYASCEDVVALYKRKLAGDDSTEKEFEELYRRISGDWAHALASAWVGVGAGNATASWAAYKAGVSAADAWSAAWAWAGTGAESKPGDWGWFGGKIYNQRIKVMAKKLIEFLKEAS